MSTVPYRSVAYASYFCAKASTRQSQIPPGTRVCHALLLVSCMSLPFDVSKCAGYGLCVHDCEGSADSLA